MRVDSGAAAVTVDRAQCVVQRLGIRGWSVEVVLAVVGALLALVALVLPWYTVDPADLGVGQWSASAILGEPASPELETMFRDSIPSIAAHLQSGLHGYDLEHALGSAVRIVAVLAALATAISVLLDRVHGMVPFAVFIGAAAAFSIRPLTYLTQPPGLKFMTLYHHAPGLYLSFAASLLLVAAALLARTDPRAVPGAQAAPVARAYPAV